MADSLAADLLAFPNAMRDRLYGNKLERHNAQSCTYEYRLDMHAKFHNHIDAF